jgi:amino acid adenylation domain-containing protein
MCSFYGAATKEFGGEMFHDRFERHAETNPLAIAVVTNHGDTSYGELNKRANRLAGRLTVEGVGPEDIIGIALPRSIELIVAVLAIHKAGAAFLPLDPSYPDQRLKLILEEARPRFVITSHNIVQRLTPHATLIISDEGLDENQNSSTMRAQPDNAAYVIYTSGSTGKPKGVVVTHKGILNLLTSQARSFDIHQKSRVLQFASLNWDAAFGEIATALGSGAALVLPLGDLAGSGLISAINTHGVTHAILPPAILASFPTDADLQLPNLILAGETCSPQLAKKWFPGRTVYNAYGPTEATVCSTIYCRHELAEDPSIIGQAINNYEVYVLDRNLQEVASGTMGELYISGIGLARGYLNDPRSTADRFIPSPFGTAGERMYRTGDLVRRNAAGMLEFIGRTDHQVKIRGFRVELAEIELALTRQDGVTQAVVVAHHDQSVGERLIGYVSSSVDKAVEPSAIRRQMAKELPDFMVPSLIVVLDSLPLAATGKVDRRALPAPNLDSRPSLWRQPQAVGEEMLCLLCAEILGLERVGPADNLFDLGIDSLTAIRLIDIVRSKLGLDLPLEAIFEGTSIADLSNLLFSPFNGAVEL